MRKTNHRIRVDSGSEPGQPSGLGRGPETEFNHRANDLTNHTFTMKLL